MAVKSKTATETVTPWLAFRKPNPRARLRLFCFPYAGGGASIYRMWAEKLPDTVEVCPVQLPGRGAWMNAPAFTDVTLLVEALAAAILPLLDKPYALFGHSMGGLISFELARYLRRQQFRSPLHMFISGRNAPQIPDPDMPKYDLPEGEFMEELRRLNGTPREVLDNEELMMLMIPLLRADFSVCETYTYTSEPPLDCPISVFGGLQDYEVKPEVLEGWREQTSKAFMRRMLLGDHFFLHSEQAVLLRVLAQELYRLERTI